MFWFKKIFKFNLKKKIKNSQSNLLEDFFAQATIVNSFTLKLRAFTLLHALVHSSSCNGEGGII